MEKINNILKHSAFPSLDSSTTFSDVNNLIILKTCGTPSIDAMKLLPQVHLYGYENRKWRKNSFHRTYTSLLVVYFP